MDATTWIGPLEGARMLGYKQRRQFLTYMETRGFWDCGAKAPTPKGLDLGVVRPAAMQGEHEWGDTFVMAWKAYDAASFKEDQAVWTPYLSCDAFSEALRTMFRSPPSADAASTERREAAYRELQRFRFGPVLAWRCRDSGTAAAVREGDEALRLALSALDVGQPLVREGAQAAWDALSELAKVGDDHDFVRYGIIPASREPAMLAPLHLPASAGPTPTTEPSEWQRACALARQRGYPEPAGPRDEVDQSLLTVWEDGMPIALIDRNDMKWRTALTRILETGALGESPGGDHAARAERCTFRRVAEGASFIQPVIVAGRRARGTAPTTERTKERYLNFLAWMREDEDDHPLPALESDARKFVDGLGEIYGRRKRDGTLPASEKKIAYANDLARQHHVDVSFDRRSTSKEVGDFIDGIRRAEEERGGVAEAPPRP